MTIQDQLNIQTHREFVKKAQKFQTAFLSKNKERYVIEQFNVPISDLEIASGYPSDETLNKIKSNYQDDFLVNVKSENFGMPEKICLAQPYKTGKAYINRNRQVEHRVYLRLVSFLKKDDINKSQQQ